MNTQTPSPNPNQNQKTSRLERVSRHRPCPICQKDHWCLVSDDVCLCMRIKSDRPYVFRTGETGWIHRLGNQSNSTLERARIEVPKPKYKPSSYWEALVAEYRQKTPEKSLKNLADNLKLKPESLEKFKAFQYQPGVYGFPMRDGWGRMCGVRLRCSDGKKLCIKGSRNGLFIPWRYPSEFLFLVEGPTDAAALEQIGLFSIGLPSCNGGRNDLKIYLSRFKFKMVVIVSDNDEYKPYPDSKSFFNPGVDGGISLFETINVPSKIILLPAKDARDYVTGGGSRDMIYWLVRNAFYNRRYLDRLNPTPVISPGQPAEQTNGVVNNVNLPAGNTAGLHARA
jgi:hypothetical protein